MSNEAIAKKNTMKKIDEIIDEIINFIVFKKLSNLPKDSVQCETMKTSSNKSPICSANLFECNISLLLIPICVYFDEEIIFCAFSDEVMNNGMANNLFCFTKEIQRHLYVLSS